MTADEASVVSSDSPSAPQQIIVQPAPSALGRFGKWLLVALVVSLLVIMSLYGNYRSYFSPSDAPREKYHSLARHALKKIAIIDVSGPILEGEDSFAKRQIDRVGDDEQVIGVVLRVNSPGGTVTGSNYLYHHLRELAKERREKGEAFPLVVSMGSICASGGYYISMAVGDTPDSIFAEPTTWTGSIGVVIPHYNLTGALDALHIEDDSIASGPLKLMGSPTRPMSEREREVLQNLVDESFEEFKQIVVSGRPQYQKDPGALDKVATGQIFTADQALELGLVDQIGFVEAAVERALALAGESKGAVRCVRYEKQPTLLDALVGASAASRGSSLDLSALVELSVPRAYYLWSWLPAALTNTR